MWIGLELGPFTSWQFYTSFKATCWWLILQSIEIEIGQKSLGSEKKLSKIRAPLFGNCGHGGWDVSPAPDNQTWHEVDEENFLLCKDSRVTSLNYFKYFITLEPST